MDSILTAENVTKRFGNTLALDDVSLKIPKGLSMLLGPNGSGKTTLLRITCGLLIPDKGKVRIYGHDPITEYTKIKDRVSFALQRPHLPSNIKVGGFLEAVKNEKRAGNHTKAVETFGLEDVIDKKFKHLSGGFKKRVSLAQAFIGKPNLIVVDEPFANLDVEAKLHISDMINRLAKKYDISLIVITHDLGSLKPDHLSILYAGKVILCDTYQDLGLGKIQSFVMERKGKIFEVFQEEELRCQLMEGATIKDVKKLDFDMYLKERFKRSETMGKEGAQVGEKRMNKLR